MSKPHRFFYFWAKQNLMKNTFLFFLCLCTAQIALAQQVKLQISNKETNEPVEFATVLLPNYKKSFVANEKGLFVVDAKKYNFPLTVVVETFGFEKKEIVLQNTTTITTTLLDPASELLQEIIIPPTNAKIKERTFGRTNEGSGKIAGFFRSYDKDNKDSGLEFGMIISTNDKLKKVKKIHWHIGSVDFNKAMFNLQFYEVENGKPTKKIPHSKINFNIVKGSKGWNVINVEGLEIFIDGNKKVAAILKTLKVDLNKEKENNYLGVNIGSAIGNQIVGRDSQFEDWHKFPMNYPFYITVDSYE